MFAMFLCPNISHISMVLTLESNFTVATVLSTGSMTTKHLGSRSVSNLLIHRDTGKTNPFLSTAST